MQGFLQKIFIKSYRGFHEKGTLSYLGAQGWIYSRHLMSVRTESTFFMKSTVF